MPTTTRQPTLTLYNERSGFDALQPEWNALLARSCFNSIFLTWEWQTTWWDSLGPGELLLLAWRDESGDLIGIAPLFLDEEDGVRRLHLVGCTEVADYLDIIIAAGHEAEVYAAFLQFLNSGDAPDWDEVSLCNLHELSSSYRLLPELVREAGLEAEVAQEDVAPHLTLPASFDEYLAALTKKQRHEIRRKRRKLEREVNSWRWFQIKGGGELDGWVDRFIELHRMASDDKEDFMTEEMSGFFHDIAHTAAENGWLDLAFIEINDQLASTMFNFDYDGRIWVYNSGYNPAAYGQLSPGIVLTSYLIEDAIASGHAVFDFLQGDEIYKYRFGAVDAKVMRTSLTRK